MSVNLNMAGETEKNKKGKNIDSVEIICVFDVLNAGPAFLVHYEIDGRASDSFLINAHPNIVGASATLDLFNFDSPENRSSRYILTSPRSLKVR